MCALIAPALSAPEAGDDNQAKNRGQDIAAGCGMPDDQIKDGCLPSRVDTIRPDAEKPAPKSMMDGKIDRIDTVPGKGSMYVVIVQA